MPAASGKRAFLEVLKQEGVTTMFGNPGTTEHAHTPEIVEIRSLSERFGLRRGTTE